ncbi:hypothetical protein LJ725_25360 [Reyranella aquatilis]|uniref:Uncharacterized protein n=1 Tax=Reyranella aquatilis TaxID=2035356 RepID=A0ABS8L1W7_9HYPH|nr:hypothetical protein [Reyranella aquatilis]MCC8432317.1 hypothetical protein [Reyranella aquatilis]
MAQQIAVSGIEGKLEVNEDGELIYAKSGLETEVLTADEAIRRWPAAASDIRRALKILD